MNMLEHISRQEHVLEQVQADLQAFHKLEQKRNKKLLKKVFDLLQIIL